MTAPAAAPCEGCPLGATGAVASRGPLPARILLLSGMPGYHEAREGVAFASPAFGWLEDTLRKCGLDPATVHFATIIGCRPPRPRPLRSEEVEACRARLNRTIEAASPEVIVLCGREVAAAMLPESAAPIVLGRVVAHRGRRYYPVRHPYATLHHQVYIRRFEDDLQRLAELLARGQIDAMTLEADVQNAPPRASAFAAQAGPVGQPQRADGDAEAPVEMLHGASTRQAADRLTDLPPDTVVGPAATDSSDGELPPVSTPDVPEPGEEDGPAQLALF